MSARNAQKEGRIDGWRRGDGWEECTFSTNAHLVLGVVLEETLDTTARELLNIKSVNVAVTACTFLELDVGSDCMMTRPDLVSALLGDGQLQECRPR